MINLFVSLIGWIIILGIIIWIAIVMCKSFLSVSKKKQSKEILKLVENFEKGFRKIYRRIFQVIGMLVNVFISALIGIAMKPLIFKINYPLGEEYAIWASYAVAILIYTVLPSRYRNQNKGSAE